MEISIFKDKSTTNYSSKFQVFLKKTVYRECQYPK